MLKRTFQVVCDRCKAPGPVVETSEFDAYTAATRAGLMKSTGYSGAAVQDHRDLCSRCRGAAGPSTETLKREHGG